MTELEMIQKSVEMCNQRDVLLKECAQYFPILNTKFQTLDEYKESYWNAHGPHKFYAVISFLASYLMFYFFGIIKHFEQYTWGMFVAVPGIFIVAMIIYYAVFRNIHMRCCKSTFDEYVETVKEFEELKPAIIAERDEVNARLRAHEKLMRNESNCIIPERYCDHANELLYLIKNKRAVDLVSAINKYEDIQFQKDMKQMAADTLMQTEMAAHAAQQAKINSELAAKKANEAADISRFNLYLTYLDSKD